MGTRKLMVSKRNSIRVPNNENGFRTMRRMVFATSPMVTFYAYAIANLFDEVREMPIGSEIYFGYSRMTIFREKSLNELERRMNKWENSDMEELHPIWYEIHAIKKTAKCYILKNIDNDFVY